MTCGIVMFMVTALTCGAGGFLAAMAIAQRRERPCTKQALDDRAKRIEERLDLIEQMLYAHAGPQNEEIKPTQWDPMGSYSTAQYIDATARSYDRLVNGGRFAAD